MKLTSCVALLAVVGGSLALSVGHAETPEEWIKLGARVHSGFGAFIPAGIRHILLGPEHLLFVVGLLLLGGSVRHLVIVVTSFTLAHSITLSLAALNIVSPPARVIEPAIVAAP